MITIKTWALIALLLTSYVSIDLILCGILLLSKRGPFWNKGRRVLILGMALTTVPLAILSWSVHIGTGVFCAVMWVIFAIAGLLDLLHKQSGGRKAKNKTRKKTADADTCSAQDYIRAINAILREKGKDAMCFDRSSFDSALTKDALPWCRRRDAFIDCIETGEDDTAIYVTTWGLTPERDKFDGSEGEDFDTLFHFVYDELLRDPDKEKDADEWLSDFKKRMAASRERAEEPGRAAETENV